MPDFTREEVKAVEAPQKILKLIDIMEWHEAKTYAKTAPHEYALWRDLPYVKGWREKDCNRKTFVDFSIFIQEYGYVAYFWKTPFTYLNVGKWKYWNVDEWESQPGWYLINRALLEQ